MSFFKKLSSLFSGSAKSPADNVYHLRVKCNRCGEIIEGRVNLANDLSIEYGEGEKVTYFCRKVLMGTQRCFQQVELRLTFDVNRNLLDQQINGGSFVSE